MQSHGLRAALLLGAFGSIVPGLAQAAATTPVAIQGGVATAQSGLIGHEFTLFNAGQSAVAFTPYAVSSGTAQTAFILNEPSQLLAAATFDVNFAVSESQITAPTYAEWTIGNTQGQSAGRNLLQIPLVGTAVAIPVVAPGITLNGQVKLDDNDLCRIFSGAVTDWSKLDVPLPAGPITVVYRSDSGGTSYNLTNHLAQVCNSGNSNFTPGFAPSTSFASIFPGGVVPVNFHAVQKNSGVVNYLSSLSGVTVTSAIGYTSPDYTSLAPAPDSKLSNGNPSALVVAELKTGTKYYTPTPANITTGLLHPGAGATNTGAPESATDAANPLDWVPNNPAPASGYPIVAYSVLLVPQCAANPAVSAGLLAFLTAHYSNSAYLAVQANNGLAKLSTSAAGVLTAIKANLLANKNKWNVDIQDKTACKAVTGR
jgi:ABC-type phosphate transport system substrate-binding protein